MLKNRFVRPGLTARLARALRTSPVAALTGARQCGKTTLARALAATRCSTYFDLEDPLDLERLAR